MRLNFAGVPEENIREGIRRIGKVVGEQVRLFGTLTGSPLTHQAPESAPQAPESAPPALKSAPVDTATQSHATGVDPELADIVELPRAGEQPRRRRQGR